MNPNDSNQAPTPFDLKNLQDALPVEPKIHIDETRIAELTVLIAELGLESSSAPHEQTENWTTLTVKELVPNSERIVTGEQLLEVWRKVLDSEIQPSLTDLLCVELWASINYPDFAKSLKASKRRFTYSKTLLAIRKRVAYTLYEYARDLNWTEPVKYVSALKVARAYLRDATGHSEASRWDDYGQFAGKLGVSTVLISGFEPVPVDDANEAYEAIKLSLRFGNDPETALPYLLDAAVLRFDANQNITQLKDSLDFASNLAMGMESPSLLLSQAQARIRLGVALGQQWQFDEAERLTNRCEQIYDRRASQHLTILILRGLLSFFRSIPQSDISELTAVGLRIPFGFRYSQEVHPLLIKAAKNIFRELHRSNRTDDPMVARILADLVVNARTGLGISEEQAVEASIRYRDVPSDDRDLSFKLVRFHDQLRYANVRNCVEDRLNAICGLAALDADPRATATVRMLIAKETESSPFPTGNHLEQLAGNSGIDSPEARKLISLAIDGRYIELWRLAAESALSDANLTQIDLGGRSGVRTVGDYYGLASESLVYKQMDSLSFSRGNRRTANLSNYIEEHGLGSEYGVLFNLNTSHDGSRVVVARRYISGIPVMEYMRSANGSERVSIVSRTARFLGVINRAESEQASNQQVRKDLKTKEMGRFLKSCGVENYLETFNSWWNIVGSVDPVTRRDSHLDNWLLSEHQKIVAIDLEAIGSRPFGYDLAQMTDDHAFFEPSDWATRRQIFDAYVDEINPVASRDHCWRSYKGCVLARILWAITSPERAPQFEPGEAESRLQTYMNTVEDPELAAIARVALSSLLARRGLTSLPHANRYTTGAGRIRLSKQIAYHLRHNLDLGHDSNGWVPLDVLQRKIQNVSREEIATIATDPREPRFELAGMHIRARYGHNSALNITLTSDSSVSVATVLYHASPWVHATRILDQSDGLRPQKRARVHLSNSLDEAVANGIRGGHPLLYETTAHSVNSVLKAGTHTFLVPFVPAGGLTVVPLSSYWKHLPAIRFDDPNVSAR